LAPGQSRRFAEPRALGAERPRRVVGVRAAHQENRQAGDHHKENKVAHVPLQLAQAISMALATRRRRLAQAASA